MLYQITYVDHDGNTVKRQVPAEALDLRENNVARYKGYALLAMQPVK